MVRSSVRALLLLGLLAVETNHAPPGAPNVILFLSSLDAPRLDDRAFGEAISIYTRDLGLELRTRRGAPLETTSESLGKAAALVRESGARVGFWYRVRRTGTRGDVVLYALSIEAGHVAVHAMPVEEAEASSLYRVLALKLRAVLTGAADLEPQEPVPPVAVPEAPTPPAEVPAVPCPAVEPPTVPAPCPAPAPYQPAFFVATGYLLTVPLDPSLLRHGALVEVALPFASHWELLWGMALSTLVTRSASVGTATSFDLPLHVGIRFVLRRGPLSLGLAPIVALHLFSADGYGADGSHGSAHLAGLGLGAQVSARVRLSDHFELELRLGGEQVVPQSHLVLHGVPVLDVGGTGFTLGAGVRFAGP